MNKQEQIGVVAALLVLTALLVLIAAASAIICIEIKRHDNINWMPCTILDKEVLTTGDDVWIAVKHHYTVWLENVVVECSKERYGQLKTGKTYDIKLLRKHIIDHREKKN